MSNSSNESRDPIMQEVRRNRESLAASFGGDVRKLAEYLNEQAAKSGRKVMARPPRRSNVAPPAA